MKPAGDVMSPAGFRRAVAVAVLVLMAGCGTDDPAQPDEAPAASTTTVAATSAPGDTGELDVQGHRGARGLRPENTLPAFEIALDLGVSTLELDLHYTADGEVVVWHDDTIDPEKCGLSAGAPAGVPDPDDVLVADRDRLIAGLSRTQLTWYRCDRNPSPESFPDQRADPTALAGDDYRIVTLGELFDFVASYADSPAKTESQRAAAATVTFNVETKRKPDRPEAIGDGFDGRNAGPFELAILAEITQRSLQDRVVVQSFDHRSLWAVHAADPEIRLAALSVRDPVDAADLEARGASIWSPNLEAVDRDSLEDAHDAGLEVIPWTVNDPIDMIALIELGVDGLITDRPDTLLGLLEDRAAAAGS